MFQRIIIAALMLTTAVAVASCRRSDVAETSSGDAKNSAGRETVGPVQDYLQVADAAGAETTRVDDEFLADALRKLAGALGTLQLADLDLQVALRVAAEHVLQTPQPAGTPAAVRSTLISAAEAIEAGGAADAGLRQSAESLRPDRPLLEQIATVRDFLHRSGPAIRDAAGQG